jgi:hypothetical protein
VRSRIPNPAPPDAVQKYVSPIAVPADPTTAHAINTVDTDLTVPSNLIAFPPSILDATGAQAHVSERRCVRVRS